MAKQPSTKKKFKVIDAVRFKESFSPSVPHYKGLSKGDEVVLAPNEKITINWLLNNFIKEVK